MKKNIIWEYFLVTLGTAGVAAAAYFFMFPCNLAIGSVSGMAMIANRLIGVRISLASLIINVALLIIGLIFVGRDFGFKTVYSTVIMSGFLYIYEVFFPMDQSLTGDAFIDMICYCITCAISEAILLNINASSGGIDIIAKMMNKYLGIEMATGMIIVGLAVVVPSVFMYDSKTTIIAVLGTYLSGVAMDYYMVGFTTKKKICIISSKYEEIADYVKNKLLRGVTFYEIEGGYSGKKAKELVTILNRDEYLQLMNYVEELDSGAFMTVGSVNEVVGEWRPKKYRLKQK